MHLSYDGLNFTVLHLEDWMREAVYTEDQTTFLYWHHQIVVTCILNNDAVAANQFPQQQFVDGHLKGFQVGAPAQVPNAKPNNATPRTDLTPDQWGGSFPAGKTSGDNGFTGGGDFGPGPPGPTDNIGRPRPPGGFSPLPAPPPGFNPGGDFSPFKPRPPKPPGVKFGPDKKQDAGKPNPKVPGALLPNPVRATVPFTDVELRNRLRRPRRQLLVWLDSGPNGAPEFMLVSPLHPDAGSDALHGPVCTIMDLPEIHGNVSAVLRLKFDTWEAPALEFEDTTIKDGSKPTSLSDQASVEGRALAAAQKAFNDAIAKGKSVTEAVADADEAARKEGLKALSDQQVKDVQAGKAGDPPGNADPKKPGDQNKKKILRTPALLSNRWTMSFGWNPDTYLRTQTIMGEATFRMDVLALRKLSADQLRGYIWHPIPQGYRRRPLGQDDIAVSPGGNSLKYHIVDEQVMMNFPGGVQFGMIHADVQMEFEYHGFDAANVPGGSANWGKDGGSRMHSVPRHTTN